MSTNPLFSPIHALDYDVLLYIFDFNADMFSDRQALHTTRFTSQVCNQWRELVLNAPSLWAKLFDMDHIFKRWSPDRSPEWRNELIQRSGAAPLWIRADSSGMSTGLFEELPEPYEQYKQQFFVDLVTGNCHRIQKLVILGMYSMFTLTHSMLCFPTPQLEICEAPFGAGRYPKTDAPITSLFANHAPMLRRFNLRRCLVDQRAPWLRHLHSMELDHLYGVRDALAVLSVMHSLQELTINDMAEGDDADTPLPVASLSHLKYLEYNGKAKSGTALLDHLEIPPGCSLIINISDHRDPDAQTRITGERSPLLSIVSIFTQHAEHSSRSYLFDAIHLTYRPRYKISLTCETALPGERSLSISIPLYDNDNDSTQSKIFLDKLIPLDLASVTKFRFAAEGPLHPCFGTFFKGFPSVDTIFIDKRTFSHLGNLQYYLRNATHQPRIMFPILKAIDLATTLRNWETIFSVNQVAAAYLLMRMKSGHPVITLDMSNNPPLNIPPKLDALARVDGLKVLYRLKTVEAIIEYTCGSDDPENTIDTI